MTFYNVISGIYFLATCQVFLATLGTPQMWCATTLLVTILNESALTSELIERKVKPVEYKLPMKLLDFLTFGILVWALLILSPKTNTFNVDVSETLWGVGHPRWFFLLLAAYWLITFGWNSLAKQFDPTLWKPWFIVIMKFTWLPFLILAAATWTVPDFGALWAGWGVIATATVGGYMLLKLVAAAKA